MLNLISLPEIENAVDFVCEASIYDGVHTGRFSSGSAPTMSSEVYDGVHTGRFHQGLRQWHPPLSHKASAQAHFHLVPNVARGTPQCP